MATSFKNGFIRPDGSLLLGDHHDALARKEFKESPHHLKGYQMDPNITPSINLINAGYLLISSYSIIIPKGPTTIQSQKLIALLSSFELNDIPVIEGSNSSAILSVIKQIPSNNNNEALKFLRAYLSDIYTKMNTDNTR